MKPIFLSRRPILPPVAALGPETAVFGLQTAPPFGAGAALDAAGAEFPLPGASLAVAGADFRRAGASLAELGAEFRRAGASLEGAGAAVRRSGAAPISCTEAPAAWSGAPIARSGHPGAGGVDAFYGSAGTPTRIGNPAGRNRSTADRSVRAPLDLTQPGTVNREPRTEPA